MKKKILSEEKRDYEERKRSTVEDRERKYLVEKRKIETRKY